MSMVRVLYEFSRVSEGFLKQQTRKKKNSRHGYGRRAPAAEDRAMEETRYANASCYWQNKSEGNPDVSETAAVWKENFDACCLRRPSETWREPLKFVRKYPPEYFRRKRRDRRGVFIFDPPYGGWHGTLQRLWGVQWTLSPKYSD